MDKVKVSMVKCGSYATAQVEAAVKRAVDLLGGIEAFIKPGEKVLLKPNLLIAAAPDKGITTHPEVVRAVIRLIKPITRNIVCGDSPSVWCERIDIDRVYEVSGIKKVCEEEDVELVHFNQAKVVKGYPLAAWAFSCDKVVNIPKFKTHGLTILTACLKNLFGLVLGMTKMKLHFDYPKPADLSRVIVDIYEARQPDLNILDGIMAMEGDGPGSAGTVKKMDLIAAGSDGVGLDMVLARLMKVDDSVVPTNKEARARGLGPASVDSIDILGDGLNDFAPSDFKLPRTSALVKLPPMPEWLQRFVISSLALEPYIEASRCKLCGVCQKSCPGGAIRMSHNLMVLDHSKCIHCLCCQETCPHNAVAVRRSLLMRLLFHR